MTVQFNTASYVPYFLALPLCATHQYQDEAHLCYVKISGFSLNIIVRDVE